jgi:hypothetical protein
LNFMFVGVPRLNKNNSIATTFLENKTRLAQEKNIVEEGATVKTVPR